MRVNIGKYLMIALLLGLFNTSQAADNDDHISISGKVKAGSVNNEVHILINNNTGKTILGVKAKVLRKPGNLENFRIEPIKIDIITPNNSEEFIVHFDVSTDTPQGKLGPVKFRLSTDQGGLEETEPEMILTVEKERKGPRVVYFVIKVEGTGLRFSGTSGGPYIIGGSMTNYLEVRRGQSAYDALIEYLKKWEDRCKGTLASNGLPNNRTPPLLYLSGPKLTIISGPYIKSPKSPSSNIPEREFNWQAKGRNSTRGLWEKYRRMYCDD